MIEILYYDNGLKKGKVADLNKLKNYKKWIDITDITKEEKDLVQKTFNLHPLTAEDLINPNIAIKIEEFPDHILSIFYGIKKNKTSFDLIEIDFILGNNFLITNHKIPIDSFEKLKTENKILRSVFTKSIDFLFHQTLDVEVDNYFPILNVTDDLIEKLEEKVTKKPKPELLQQILILKRKIVLIKKTVMPQREKISLLTRSNNKFISNKAVPYFRDIHDHAIRVADIVDDYREAVGGTFDSYMSAVSNNMNEVMKILSIFATIALPLGVISGIYGTNFDIIPGQHIPYGFWFMIFLMLLVIAAMIYMFKRRNWF